MDIRVRVRARVRVSVRVSFCGHYVDIVAANCGRLRLQPTVTQFANHNFKLYDVIQMHFLAYLLTYPGNQGQ